MTIDSYFTTDKLNSLKSSILTYFPTTNTQLFDVVYARIGLVINRLAGVELLYTDSNILDAFFINNVISVLDKKWLYLLKFQSILNLSMNSLDDLSLKTDFTSDINATLNTNGTNNDTGSANSKYSTGYKGFDSINNDASFSVDKDDKSYSNNRSFNTTNKETRGLTSQKSKQDLEQYIALFNSTLEEFNELIFSKIIRICRLLYGRI